MPAPTANLISNSWTQSSGHLLQRTKPATATCSRRLRAHIVNFHRGAAAPWVVTLSGSVVIGLGDGSSMTFHPGDVFSPKDHPAKATPPADELETTLCQPRLNNKYAEIELSESETHYSTLQYSITPIGNYERTTHPRYLLRRYHAARRSTESVAST